MKRKTYDAVDAEDASAGDSSMFELDDVNTIVQRHLPAAREIALICVNSSIRN